MERLAPSEGCLVTGRCEVAGSAACRPVPFALCSACTLQRKEPSHPLPRTFRMSSATRLAPGTDCLSFLRIALEARRIQVLPTTPEIAALSVALPAHGSQDLADRLIAANAVHHKALLVTSDRNLCESKEIPTLW